MQPHELYFRQVLPISMDKAWKFFTDPNNLSKITPRDMNFRIRSLVAGGPIYTGMQIAYTVSPVLKVPVSWLTEITEVAEQRSFTDTQIRGPFKLWKHKHTFTASEIGVLMTDHIQYSITFPLLDAILNRLFVRKRLKAIFDYRYQILNKYNFDE